MFTEVQGTEVLACDCLSDRPTTSDKLNSAIFYQLVTELAFGIT